MRAIVIHFEIRIGKIYFINMFNDFNNFHNRKCFMRVIYCFNQNQKICQKDSKSNAKFTIKLV